MHSTVYTIFSSILKSELDELFPVACNNYPPECAAELYCQVKSHCDYIRGCWVSLNLSGAVGVRHVMNPASPFRRRNSKLETLTQMGT